jgi:hypothetical protein
MTMASEFRWQNDGDTTIRIEDGDAGLTVRIEGHDEGVRSVSVEVTDIREADHFMVERHLQFGGKELRPATVNWSACGAVPVATADRFATFLQFAVRVAKTLDVLTFEAFGGLSPDDLTRDLRGLLMLYPMR